MELKEINTKCPIVFVYYIDCTNIHREDIRKYIDTVVDAFLIKDSDILQYYIPIFNENSRIECINPQIVSIDEYNGIKQRLDKMQEKFEEFLKNN